MINGQRAQQRRDWRIWGGILVVFVCGVLVGTVATGAYHNYERQHRWEQGLAGMKPRVMKHLTHELRLSDDQRHAFEVIMSQAEAELLHLRIDQQPRVDDVLVKTLEALRGTLTPEQQSKLDEQYNRLQKRWASDRAYAQQLQSGMRP
jgi:Spy/CpxP family protein refolding chaperone